MSQRLLDSFLPSMLTVVHSCFYHEGLQRTPRDVVNMLTACINILLEKNSGVLEDAPDM